MKNQIALNAKNQIVFLKVADVSQTGSIGLTGLVYNSSGIKFSYIRTGDTSNTNVTLVSMSSLNSFVSGGLREVDSINMPGWYTISIPDLAFAKLGQVGFCFSGANNMFQVDWEIAVVANDPLQKSSTSSENYSF